MMWYDAIRYDMIMLMIWYDGESVGGTCDRSRNIHPRMEIRRNWKYYKIITDTATYNCPCLLLLLLSVQTLSVQTFILACLISLDIFVCFKVSGFWIVSWGIFCCCCLAVFVVVLTFSLSLLCLCHKKHIVVFTFLSCSIHEIISNQIIEWIV